MATFTVQVIGACRTGGEHIGLDVLRDGQQVKRIMVCKTDMLTTNLDWEAVIPFFLREVVKRSGATTLAQAKTAVEAASWVI